MTLLLLGFLTVSTVSCGVFCIFWRSHPLLFWQTLCRAMADNAKAHHPNHVEVVAHGLNATMIPPPSRPIVPLQHSPPTVHTKIHTDPAQSNHVSPPMPSLQDMSPSIFKIVPRKNGLVMWCMLFIIQIGCELPMNSSRENVLRSPPLCHKTRMMPPKNSSTRSMPGSKMI